MKRREERGLTAEESREQKVSGNGINKEKVAKESSKEARKRNQGTRTESKEEHRCDIPAMNTLCASSLCVHVLQVSSQREGDKRARTLSPIRAFM